MRRAEIVSRPSLSLLHVHVRLRPSRQQPISENVERRLRTRTVAWCVVDAALGSDAMVVRPFPSAQNPDQLNARPTVNVVPKGGAVAPKIGGRTLPTAVWPATFRRDRDDRQNSRTCNCWLAT